MGRKIPGPEIRSSNADVGAQSMAELGAQSIAAKINNAPVKRPKFGKVQFCSTLIATFVGRHSVAIANVTLTVLTVGGEELLEKFYFKCPCEHVLAQSYALCYTLGIFAILWMLGIVLYNTTWKICHGCICCKSCWKSCVCKVYNFQEGRGNCRKCGQGCWTAICGPTSRSFYGLILSVLLKTAVVPTAWIFITLVDGDYLACMEANKPCQQQSDGYVYWKHFSQMYAYTFLPVFLACAIIFRAIYRCCTSKNYRLHRFTSLYRDVEDEVLAREMPETANKLSERVVKAFLEKPELKEGDWAKISDQIITDASDVASHTTQRHPKDILLTSFPGYGRIQRTSRFCRISSYGSPQDRGMSALQHSRGRLLYGSFWTHKYVQRMI